jgi:hypothetical protein
MERDEIDETQREAKEKRGKVCTYGTVVRRNEQQVNQRSRGSGIFPSI